MKLLDSPTDWWIDGNVSGALLGLVFGALIWAHPTMWWTVGLIAFVVVWFLFFVGVMAGIDIERHEGPKRE